MKALKTILSVTLAVLMLAGSVPTVVFAAVGNENGGLKLDLVETDDVIDPSVPWDENGDGDEEAPVPEPAPDEVVRVAIVLERAPAIDKGFPIDTIATDRDAARYMAKLETAQEAVAQRIGNTVLSGEKLDVEENLTLVANLISADVEYGQIEEIKKVEGVKDVVIEQVYAPFEAEEGEGGAEALADTLAELPAYTGAGSKVAIIDSGVDHEHISFDPDALDYALERYADDSDGDGKISKDELEEYKKSIGFMTEAEVKALVNSGRLHASGDVFMTGKVPFAYNYADKNNKVINTKGNYHGSHVAGIAAANIYVKGGDGFVSKVGDASAVVGSAPDAQILNLRVFGSALCTDTVIAAAVEDAMYLGADVLNLSLGTAEMGFACADGIYGDILDKLADEGVIIMGALGNDGSWMGENTHGQNKLYVEDVNMSTATPPSSYEELMAVAWSDGGIKNGTLSPLGGVTGVTVNDSSAYGIPSSLTLKPEITANGTNINSVNSDVESNDGYKAISGTSMAAPDVAGAAAAIAH